MGRPPVKLFKPVLWLLCLAPLVRLIYLGFSGRLGANPIEYITLSTGIWTLVLLMGSLTITPLRRITGQSWVIKFRRPIGLFAFFYGCLHFTTYIWLDKFFDLKDVLKDIAKRPFITMGFLAFVLLIPLAATSTAGSIRRLGRRWQTLHRLVYFSAAAAVVHFWWKQKADIREPFVYAIVLGSLLLIRILFWTRRAVSRPAVRIADDTPHRG